MGYFVQVNVGVFTSTHVAHTWIVITKPDGTQEAWGLYPLTNSPGNIFYGPGIMKPEDLSEGNQVSASTGPISITQDQYNDFSMYNKT